MEPLILGDHQDSLVDEFIAIILWPLFFIKICFK